MTVEQGKQALMDVASQMTEGLKALAGVASQVGAPTDPFNTALQAFQQGISGILSAAGAQDTGSSPTEAGPSFPGAGMSNA